MYDTKSGKDFEMIFAICDDGIFENISEEERAKSTQKLSQIFHRTLPIGLISSITKTD
jgi:hypothetical protein